MKLIILPKFRRLNSKAKLTCNKTTQSKRRILFSLINQVRTEVQGIKEPRKENLSLWRFRMKFRILREKVRGR
jgi:hypothetical protein